MKEMPILFSAPMVQAILAWNKTQTRRIIKPQPLILDSGGCFYPDPKAKHYLHYANEKHFRKGMPSDFSKYGQPGDHLWVRETFAKHPEFPGYIYRADRGGDYQGATQGDFRWKTSIHMPRAASRITLEITGMKIERLNAITRGDAMAEGCPFRNMADTDPMAWYALLWEKINGKGSWSLNSWVWAISFKRI